MSKPHTPLNPSSFTEDRLRQMIRGLRPDKEFFAGRKFFERLLDTQGIEGVIDFVNRTNDVFDKRSDLDLFLHFNEAEREVFHHTYLKLWSRREFLNTAGWGIPGAVITATAARDLVRRATRDRADDFTDYDSTAIERAGKEVKGYVVPASELLLGAALVHESMEKWTQMKLEQIADAVEVLGEKMQNEAKSKAASAAR